MAQQLSTKQGTMAAGMQRQVAVKQQQQQQQPQQVGGHKSFSDTECAPPERQ